MSDNVAPDAATWPRLYLDTAEILGIADGRSDLETIRRLLEAMWARCVVLVVSLEHLQDALTRSDSDAPTRVSSALEQFRLRGVVTRGPCDIEPWQTIAEDITIAPAANIRDLIMHPRRAPTLAELAAVQDAVHNADVGFQKAQTAVTSLTISQAEHHVALQVIITLVRGWRGIDVDNLIDFWAQELKVSLSQSKRTHLVAHLQPIAELMAKFVDDPRFDQAARLSILTRMRDGFGASPRNGSPGLFLAGRLATSRTRNRMRTPIRSDSLDGLHAMYFPYVDVATCDRQTFHCISPHIPSVRGSRRPTLIRNGQLQNLITAIETLPRSDH